MTDLERFVVRITASIERVERELRRLDGARQRKRGADAAGSAPKRPAGADVRA